MGRAINKLSAKGVEALNTPGWQGDGGGLWLRITEKGAKRWVFIWKLDKRRHEMGLGPLASVVTQTP
ncbi:Arm DNA-binding domain-containing protein [Sphingomonas lycopersici]|uniref:Arm DNA-binding domain-containing protein n=1 Tax=Sphingomonas lycopersici TaxID=2951807 RepID=A0AA41ZCU2_9SPHN|nr:Arm DNA-binding domain-containing protein [Sphingomonas lycopersici]MCW6534281.1 Arm DNA-binding domain-containing protein [Sphingomonas lycopersici]